MKSRYKIKHRSQKWDRLPNGFYIYSRQFKPCINGRQGFKRRRISGVFKTRGEAATMAGLMALKLNEIKKKVKRYPVKCIKTPNRLTSQAICIHCRRICKFSKRGIKNHE